MPSSDASGVGTNRRRASLCRRTLHHRLAEVRGANIRQESGDNEAADDSSDVNSLIMTKSAAVFGTALIFISAFVVEKPRCTGS